MSNWLTRRRREPNSLFGEILDWMLSPLLLLWPVSIFFTYQVATAIAHRPYDEMLADVARTLMDAVVVDAHGVRVPEEGTNIMPLRAGQSGWRYQIRTPDAVMAGDPALPAPPLWLADPDPTFHDVVLAGEPMRLARLIAPKRAVERVVLIAVQVAEPIERRQALVTEVITGVMLPQFAIVPIAVVLVWFGLSRGLRPLAQLQAHLAQRRPSDLSPLDPERVPEEIRPLIVAFNALMQRLETNLAAQRRFIADAAHQMRTPITALKIQAELALRATNPQEQRRALEQLHHAASRSAHLITQLLTLARTEASSEQVHQMAPTDLVTILRDVLMTLYPKASATRLELTFDAPEAPVEVLGNALMLGELFKNLIDNAITYTPENGQVWVRLITTPAEVRIHIDDTGPGIPPEWRERVFEPFVRLPEACCDGSGLGLAIAREIAQRHRAQLVIGVPDSGQGTRVTVSFPLEAQARGSAPR